MGRFIALPAGVLFALGLAASGMTQPSKVIGFLDVTGHWDPSLAFVMLGAIAVHFVAQLVARRRSEPSSAPAFELPGLRERLDGRLVAGAAVFGIGWGLSGYCPGPVLVSLAGGTLPAAVMCASMLIGVSAHDLWFAPRAVRRKDPVCGGADLSDA